MVRKKANTNKIEVRNIRDVSGKVTIVGGDIYEGLSVEQVSILLDQLTSKYQRKPFNGRCPYKGLDVFDEEDADLFFGRERLVDDLVTRVKESRTVFITGPSGSGKSSLVRAGLIHALKQGAIKSSKSWLYETMKPGREPLKDLALAFSRLKSPELQDYFLAHTADIDILNKCAESALSGRKDQRFVLFVDQFEEVFTQINKEDERVAFINMLAYAGTAEGGRVTVLFAMRSDFVSNCATYPLLNELLSQQFRQIGAMQPEELVSAIALPALHVGLPLENELIAQITQDMKGEPDALPLMQFALKDLFDAQQAEGGVTALTLQDYLKHGGIHKSLARHADATFAKLSEREQELARSIFSGLIEIGRGTQDTKRTALFDELVPANIKPEDVSAIVQRLADARLIITDEQAGKDTVTISHEKLIEAWPWLKKLVNENRDSIALQNEIAGDAKEWDDRQREASYLYTGARLINVREQLQTKRLVLSDLAQTFVLAGQAKQLHNRRIQISALLSIVGLIIIAIAIYYYEVSIQLQQTAAFAKTQESSAKTQEALASTAQAIAQTAQANAEEAQKQSRIARAGELSAESVALKDNNFIVALLLEVEAFKINDTVQTHAVLLDNARTNPQLEQNLIRHSGAVTTVAFSPDGKFLASGSSDKTIILWNVETRKPIGQPLTGHKDVVESIAFSPDGKTLASGSADNTILLWNVETRRPMSPPLRKQNDDILSLAFSPDGKLLASSSGDETIVLWDVEKREPIGQPLKGHTGWINSVAFSPNGKILASADTNGMLILWDAQTGQPIGQPLKVNGWVESIAFSPDGKILASGSADNTIILWDLETRQPKGQPLNVHTESVESIAFSPDGKLLASASADNIIILWDVETRQPIDKLHSGTINGVFSVAFSPDGGILASGNGDNTITLWNMQINNTIGQLFRDNNKSGIVDSIAFSPDGKMLASGNLYDNTTILWDAKTQLPLRKFTPGLKLVRDPNNANNIYVDSNLSSVLSVAFSPDGKMLASGGADNTVLLWDVGTGQPIGQPLTGHTGPVDSVAFSPNGRLLASGSEDNTIILWDVKTKKPIGTPLNKHTGGVTSVAFSPNGDILASNSWDKTIILWDLDRMQPLGQPLIKPSACGSGTDITPDIAFSPDGKTLASTDTCKTVLLWNIKTGKISGEPLTGHTASVYSVAFSPNGKILASGSDDQTVILWDAQTGQPIGQPLKGHTGRVNSLAFSLNGKMLASGSDDGTIILWDIDPLDWIQKSCQRAGRNFTYTEWLKYFPNEGYRPTCPDLPSDPTAFADIVQQTLSNANDRNRIQTSVNRVIDLLKVYSNSNNINEQAKEIVKQVIKKQISNSVSGVEDIKFKLRLLQDAKTIGLEIDNAEDLNSICWFGSIYGFASDVLEYCEQAVAIAPYDQDVRDSRGLARALTHDFKGAILDFQYFVEQSTISTFIEERRLWIEELKMGNNPFTPDVLETLRNQSGVR